VIQKLNGARDGLQLQKIHRFRFISTQA